MLFSYEGLDTVDQCSGPFNYEVFKPILLIEVSVHELLHGLPGDLVFLAFLVKLNFLSVHVSNCVLELFKCQRSMLGLADLTRMATWS